MSEDDHRPEFRLGRTVVSVVTGDLLSQEAEAAVVDLGLCQRGQPARCDGAAGDTRTRSRALARGIGDRA